MRERKTAVARAEQKAEVVACLYRGLIAPLHHIYSQNINSLVQRRERGRVSLSVFRYKRYNIGKSPPANRCVRTEVICRKKRDSDYCGLIFRAIVKIFELKYFLYTHQRAGERYDIPVYYCYFYLSYNCEREIIKNLQ